MTPAFLSGLLAALAGCSEKTAPVDFAPYSVPDVVVPKDLPLHYELVRTIPAQLLKLHGIALDTNGRLHAVGIPGIRVFDPDGKLLSQGDIVGEPTCVAVSDGVVWVGLKTKILKYDMDGKLLGSWGEAGKEEGKLGWVTSIAISGTDVMVGDSGNLCVHHFDVTGNLISELGKRGPESLGLIVPSPHLDCVFDGRNLLVTNTGRLRVETYSLTGELLGFWGKSGMQADGFVGCCNPTNIALTPDGLVVTSEKGIPRVKVYDKTGKMFAYIGSEHFSQDAAGIDLAVDGAGRIYAADPAAGKVLVFAPVKKAQ